MTKRRDLEDFASTLTRAYYEIDKHFAAMGLEKPNVDVCWMMACAMLISNEIENHEYMLNFALVQIENKM